jgi:hypothetical protein
VARASEAVDRPVPSVAGRPSPIAGRDRLTALRGSPSVSRPRLCWYPALTCWLMEPRLFIAVRPSTTLAAATTSTANMIFVPTRRSVSNR